VASLINIQQSRSLKPKVPSKDLGFGKIFTDHMYCIDYVNNSWENARIIPYAPFQLNPASSVLHYGQALFEGIKAFRQIRENKIGIFRPEYNWKRMRKGAERLCMPMLPYDTFMLGLKTLIKEERHWIPKEDGTSLYIRPTLIGTEGFLGVRPSSEYLFYIILSPVGSYYGTDQKEGIKIWIETKYTRAAPGGLGTIKAGANYACSLKAAHEAKMNNYDQVLWLDVNHNYIEEVGTMNVFFKINDKIITPSLDGTILAGSTRDCILNLLSVWKLPVEERKLSLQEVIDASKNGSLQEAFGTGTAAVISPIKEFAFRDQKIELPKTSFGPLAERLYKTLTGIQKGDIFDTYSWLDYV
jgi:branched-chain amino acid aminotransferase